MATSLPDADALRRGIKRQFLKNGPSVEAVMVIVGPVLDWYDDEIRRLTASETVSEAEEPEAILGEPPPGALL